MTSLNFTYQNCFDDHRFIKNIAGEKEENKENALYDEI